MHSLELNIVGIGKKIINVTHVLNGGYAGANTKEVQHHIYELRLLGVPAPKNVPTLYPLGAHVVSQDPLFQALHNKTSGEAEWALFIGENEQENLIMAASDHTDRALEVHGVAWSKQSAPNFIGNIAWPYHKIKDDFLNFSLKAWVKNEGKEELIQDGKASLLLPPSYWIKKLTEHGLARPGTLVMSGTIAMLASVNQFSQYWRVELSDNKGNISTVAYDIEILPPAWE